MLKHSFKRIYKITLLLLIGVMLAFWFCLPKELFSDPMATVMYDAEGKLLGASIAKDGQWRFPQSDSVPSKFKTAIIAFEDQYFYKHPGINPVSILRAIKQNYKARKVVSGASTLSMQVIRLSRKDKSRSVKEKLIEMVMALRLELRYSKEEILNFYASHAPFGGNTVGLETAAWRYYKSNAHQLSWGEAVTLAVLPNQPSLIYPGKHNDRLIEKRNRLLKKLLVQGAIDELTFELALSEIVPPPPGALPQLSPHLLARIKSANREGKNVLTSLNLEMQQNANRIIEQHYHQLSLDQIQNAALLVAEINTGKIISYCGNSPTTRQHHDKVDIIASRRSPGSTLKPFLYAASLDESLIMPESLLPDIPIYLQGFSPKNFSRDYSGSIPADQALARSLNIPFVKLLSELSYPKFNHLLKQIGFSTLNKPPDHYGLSIILGGAEVTLFDLANSYLQLTQKGMGKQVLHPLTFEHISSKNADLFPLTGPACWHTLEALQELNRPETEMGWRHFDSSEKIAWKTGTSFGFKDAWAIGMNAEYLVAVWVGNADGEGRPNIIGSRVAAPIMFDMFNHLKSDSKFMIPGFDLAIIPVCSHSGFKAGEKCETTKMEWMLPAAENHPICPYHQVVFTNKVNDRVTIDCSEENNIEQKKWFVLPPAMATYYRKKHPDYKSLPPWSKDCIPFTSNNNIELIYPGVDSEIYIPLELEGNTGKMIFELAHQQPNRKVFWHLNDQFLGQTISEHKLAAWIPQGQHHLVVVDENGEVVEKKFEVLSN